MNMKTTFIALLLSLPLVGFAQVTKKTLELPEFTSISVNSNYTVYLKQTNKQEVQVEALTEIYDLTDIRVDNGVLMINVERKPEVANKSIWAKIDDIKVNPTMKLTISMKNVNSLQVNGGGRIVAENSIAASTLNLGVAGGGSMDVDVKGDNVTAEVSGSGRMVLKGYATSADIQMSGSGSLSAFEFALESAKIRVSGSGNADLNVTNSLEAAVMGSGNIKHKGNTKNATKKVYGSGTVERAY